MEKDWSFSIDIDNSVPRTHPSRKVHILNIDNGGNFLATIVLKNKNIFKVYLKASDGARVGSKVKLWFRKNKFGLEIQGYEIVKRHYPSLVNTSYSKMTFSPRVFLVSGSNFRRFLLQIIFQRQILY